MPLTKKMTKTPAVMVETKKISSKDSCCCSQVFGDVKHLLVTVLLVLNTILLIRVLINQMTMEVKKVGGRENMRMVRQIYKSDAFKQQQKQQIQQLLQFYQGQLPQGGNVSQAIIPSNTNNTSNASANIQ